MIDGKKIIVVLPAYNAELTLKQTYQEIPFDIVDDVILVDDASHDQTIQTAQQLGIRHILRHDKNRGYGANQKTCYRKALELKAEIVIMLHPDYQYTPALIPAMAYLIAKNIFPVVLGSRILGTGARKGGMPFFKYIANRFLTFFQNWLLNYKLSEYHTGYRAFSRHILEQINYDNCSDDFIFDNQVLSQIIFLNHNIGEITCPTKYFKDSSSISFRRSVIYGFGVIRVSLEHFFQKAGLLRIKRYQIKTLRNEG